jgi:hypothetical protein
MNANTVKATSVPTVTLAGVGGEGPTGPFPTPKGTGDRSVCTLKRSQGTSR